MSEARDLLEYGLRIRMHGEGSLTGTWRDWDTKVEAYLRRGDEETPQDGLTSDEARSIFAKYLHVKCRQCKAPVGQMCVVNRGVWVHAERFVDTDLAVKQ